MRHRSIPILTFITIILCLMAFSPAYSEEKSFEGEISLKGMLTDVDGSEAKFNEYRDLTDGLYGRIRLKYDSDAYFMKFQASDIGYDTQKYTLNGGMWGTFRYDLFYYEIPHNVTFGARTFFFGAGSDNLVGAPDANIGTWNEFDYSTERKKYGAGFKLDLLKPFFFDVAVSREDREGTKPTAGNSGFSTTELPEPVDYTTDALKVEAGYAWKPVFVSLSYFYSKFDNDNETLFFQNPFAFPAGATDIITLPPDNDYHKIALKGALFLPLNSRLSLNIGSAKAKSDADLFTSFTILPSGQRFSGEIDTTNLDLAFTTNPVPFMDAKAFYRYYDRDNTSDVIDDGVVNRLFDYTRRSRGIELGFRLPAKFYLSGSYKNYNIDFNERTDVEETNSDIYAVNLRWTGLDFIAFRTGYERVNRQMDSDLPDNPAKRYDVAPMNRDSYKAYVDVSPMDSLNFTLGYVYKKTDYNDTTLGLRNDKRDEFTADADYAIGKVANLYGYFDYEKVRSVQVQRHFAGPAGIDPNGPVQDSLNFNWDLHQKDKTYDFGVGTDVYVMPKKLTLKLQYDYVKSDGDADFTYLLDSALTGGRTNSNIDASNWDDYRRRSFKIKAVYDVMKSLSVTAGYTYEKYTYDDIQTDNYQYVLPQTGVANTYLTGAYKDQDYKADIYFVGVTYRF